MNRPEGEGGCSSTTVLYQKHEQAHQDLEGPKLLLFKKSDIKGETQSLAILVGTGSRITLSFSTLVFFSFVFYMCT